MADRPILEYEPLPPRGLRRKAVVALLAASAGVSVAVGGVVYRLTRPAPATAVSPPPPLLLKSTKGEVIAVPRNMPWQPAPPPAQQEQAHGR